MATQTELEELVVRLVGDASSYLKMIADATQASKEAAQAVAETAKKVEGFGESLKKFAGDVSSAFASFKVAEWLKDAREEWKQSEVVTVRLNAAIKAQGGDVKQLAADYTEFAKQMQRTTVLSDETVKSMLAQAEAMGVTGEAAKRAVRNAAALAVTAGAGVGDAPGFLRQTIALEQGHAEMLARFLKPLRDVKDETEQAAMAQKLLAQNFGIVTDLSQTAFGRSEMFANQYKDILEEVGRIISGFVADPLKRARKELTAWFGQLSEAQKTLLVAAAAATAFALSVGPALSVLGPILTVVVSGFTALRTALMAVAAFSATEFLFNLPLKLMEIQAALQASTIASVAFKAAIATGAVYAVSELVFAVAGGNKALAEFNAALQQSADLGQKMREAAASGREKRLAEIGGLPQGERGAALADEAKRAQQQVDQLSAALDSARKAQEAADKTARHIPLAGAGYQAEYEAAKQRVDDLKKEYDAAKEYAAKVNAEAEKGKEVGANKKTLQEIAEFTKQLELQAETFGMTEREVQLYKFAMAGATDAQLAGAKAAAEELDELEKQKKARDEMQKEFDRFDEEVTRRADKVREEIKTPFGKYQDELENLGELLDLGAISFDEYGAAVEKAEEDLAKAEDQTKKTHDAIKGLDAATFGSAEGIARLAAYQDLLNNPNVLADKGGAKVGDKGLASDRAENALSRIADNTDVLRDKEPYEFEEAGVA